MMHFLVGRFLAAPRLVRARLGAAIACAAVLSSPTAQAAGTAFAVDTAEVSEPGNCKVETWASRAGNGDGLATVNPACVVNLFTPTEISAQIMRARSDSEWETSISPKAKAKLVPTAIGSFGFAIAAGATNDASAQDVSTLFAYVPATLRLSEVVRINLNGGWQLDRTSERHFAAYGVGLDVRITDVVTLTGETFGLAGKSDDPFVTHPRFQAGIRYRPVDRFSVDLIYGRNINGENADWLTLATTVRFPPE